MLRRPPIAALVVAETISSTGSQMTALALPWFVLTTTGSASKMALVVAAEVLPWALLGVPAGSAAARLGVRRTLVACNLLWAPLIGAIPVLHQAGALSFGILLALAGLFGALWPAYVASQQSILPALVGEDERRVAQASALMFTSTRLTYMVGPALAGALIALWGAPAVLVIDAVSFLVAAGLLLAFVLAVERPAAGPEPGGMLAGLRFLARDPFLRPLTIAQVASQTAFQALVVALPVLAFVRYDESAGTAGLLLGAWGGGALLGSALSYRTSARRDLRRTGELAWLAQALPLWVLVASVPVPVALAVLALSGLGNGFRVPATRGLAIVRTPPALRQQAGAASSSLAMLGGAVALAAVGPVLEELGTAPAFAGVAAVATLAAWAGVVAAARERGSGARAPVDPARADTVIDWNITVFSALTAPAPAGAGQPPPVSTIQLAMVHGAVNDAVNAIDGRYEPYLSEPRAKRWYSEDAAAATAAYRVLVAIVPGQQATLEPLYLASLAAIPPGRAKDGGVAVGDAAARAMLAARTNDGRFGPFRFTVGTLPGEWRPTLPANVNDPNAWVKDVTPFMIRRASDYRTDGPNPLTSRKYAREFEEVKSLGSVAATTRTADQTDMARFRAEGPAIWTRVTRDLSGRFGLSVADNARLFAMLYLTGADSLIASWDDKATWSFWRPITAIREAATDGNPATGADPAWLPLINNPPYPDHPSGLSCVIGAMTRTARDFFGSDRVEFSATSTNSMTTRSYSRFSEAIDEVVDARVYSGLHFRTADEDGAKIGRQVARWRERHFFHREGHCHHGRGQHHHGQHHHGQHH